MSRLNHSHVVTESSIRVGAGQSFLIHESLHIRSRLLDRPSANCWRKARKLSTPTSEATQGKGIGNKKKKNQGKINMGSSYFSSRGIVERNSVHRQTDKL